MIQRFFFEIDAPTLIAEGTRLQGEFQFFTDAEIFGVIEGEVMSRTADRLHIGKTGWVHGDVRSEGTVVVEGRIDGNVYSEKRIRLMPSAVVNGTLRAPSIHIRPGAYFTGSVEMDNPAAETETVSRKAA